MGGVILIILLGLILTVIMKNLVSKVLAIIVVSLILCQQHSGQFEIV